ncbi:MAG: UTP--glucose-1-phosphate uridylyltransferase, partial [Oscillospiraceae bacterium]
MKIKKAIIPAAGLGTRVLPATKAMPKEMLPIVDKPAIQYIVEEAVKSGIEDICIILSRGKHVVEDHFDRTPELEKKLMDSGKIEMYDEILKIANLANITYVRQQEPRGLGHAVLCARSFIGNEPFAVLYGDDVIMGELPAVKQLTDQYEKYGL